MRKEEVSGEVGVRDIEPTHGAMLSLNQVDNRINFLYEKKKTLQEETTRAAIVRRGAAQRCGSAVLHQEDAYSSSR